MPLIGQLEVSTRQLATDFKNYRYVNAKLLPQKIVVTEAANVKYGGVN